MITTAKKLCLIAALVAEFTLPTATAKPKTTMDGGVYFPIIFRPGAALSLKFSILGARHKGTSRVILQPWLPDGSHRERVTLDAVVGATTQVRVDINYERMEIGWLQLITAHGEALELEVAVEWLEGDTITSAHQPPLYPMRPWPRASRNVADLSQAGSELIMVVMNVSDRPIEVGACGKGYLDCSPSSHHTVMPRATMAFPIPEPHTPYLVVESSGASVAQVLDMRSLGLSIQTFEASSTIKYSPVK
jgi:hypothetical protein